VCDAPGRGLEGEFQRGDGNLIPVASSVCR